MYIIKILTNNIREPMKLYKKNPNNYQQIPQNVKNNIKLFNNVFEKSVANLTTEDFGDVNIDRLNRAVFPRVAQCMWSLNINTDMYHHQIQKDLREHWTSD